MINPMKLLVNFRESMLSSLRGLRSKKKEEVAEKDQSRYILWVTQFDGEGYSSSHYGWNRNQTYTYEEALMKMQELKRNYYSIEMIKYSDFEIKCDFEVE